MAELTSMKNVGKELEAKLKAVGIETAEELVGIGSKAAYSRLRMAYTNVCAVHLYALEGAICGVDFGELTKEKKDELREYADSFNYLKSLFEMPED